MCVWGGGGKRLRESCGWVDGWAIFRAQRTSSPKLLDKYYQNFIKYHDFAIIVNTVNNRITEETTSLVDTHELS